jgi:glycosyltransferase involved in cell wall biosynthesis
MCLITGWRWECLRGTFQRMFGRWFGERMPQVRRDKGLVLCFGGEDWWYHNRGHVDMQLMRRFARGGRVLYVNSIVMRKPNVGEGRMFLRRLSRKLRSFWRGLVEVEPRFHVYSPVTFPVHHVPGARQLNQVALGRQIARALGKLDMREPLVWVACPAACETALRLRHRALVYQRTDRYEEYPGVDRDAIRGFDRRLKAEADVTFYVSRQMMQQEEHQCRRAVFLDHGVDYDLFDAAAGEPWMPEELKEMPHPIVGYFGDIDAHTVDLDLVQRVAALLPGFTFVFVGTSTVATNGLKARANVRLIPRRPYDQVPHYGKCFDVAIMPWQQNEWIEACNPIKLKEYLALGKPVVSTPFSELGHYGEVVYRARGAREFAAAIEQALREDCAERVRARKERVRPYTWDSRAELALRAVSEARR